MATYVIKGEELAALHFLNPAHPKPVTLEWINRGTDKGLKPMTVRMLLRTLEGPPASPSVDRQRRAMGLRAAFANDQDRSAFAAAFLAATAQEAVSRGNREAAFFRHRDEADKAILDLVAGGIDAGSIIALACDPSDEPRKGHSSLRVASATAGGGLAGMLLGVAFLTIPGIGVVSAFGAIAVSAITNVASVSGIIGATGGAIATMLSDLDVDSRDPFEIERKLLAGRTFVAVELPPKAIREEFVRQVLSENGGERIRLGKALYTIAPHFAEMLEI
jgi:hypothetical protein